MTVGVLHLDYPNLDVAYEWIGPVSPSPLVMLHGLGDSSIITFRGIAQHLTLAGTSSLLVDLPGFGYSPAPATWTSTTEQQADVIVQVLELLQVSAVPLMGHSMGGSIAILVAHLRPDLVSHLVVAEPLLRPEQSTLGKTVAKRSEEMFVARGFSMLQLATRRQASRGEQSAVAFQEALQRAIPAIMHRSAVSLLQRRSPSLQKILENMPLPRTLLIGEYSDAGTGELEDAGVRVVRIPDAGHAMMSENPGAFAEALTHLHV